MAYMTLIDSECIKGGCKKRATHSVFNYRNSAYGDYCKKHAEEKVADLKRSEKAIFGGD